MFHQHHLAAPKNEKSIHDPGVGPTLPLHEPSLHGTIQSAFGFASDKRAAIRQANKLLLISIGLIDKVGLSLSVIGVTGKDEGLNGR